MLTIFQKTLPVLLCNTKLRGSFSDPTIGHNTSATPKNVSERNSRSTERRTECVCGNTEDAITYIQCTGAGFSLRSPQNASNSVQQGLSRGQEKVHQWSKRRSHPQELQHEDARPSRRRSSHLLRKYKSEPVPEAEIEEYYVSFHRVSRSLRVIENARK
ncbi:hypothetical protein JTE90_020084 [Oedothorax gibbosus]|uniref:Uncharacterized protein n=1 Tax=Oedothorax gibbosus TaxID=931172 RepID=A0AAV6TJX4_9ARAC|nr:hypothetical protein JTE90_020084 [Oedothorax gibbosus]